MGCAASKATNETGLMEAKIEAFLRKVGLSLDEVRAATDLNWQEKWIKDSDCKVIAYLITCGALDHLTVRWRPAALFPCHETWQVHSPD